MRRNEGGWRPSAGILTRLGAGERGAIARPLAWILVATGAVCVFLWLLVETQATRTIPPRLAAQRPWGHPDPRHFYAPMLAMSMLLIVCAWIGRRLLRLRL